jgi:hypothetical protein
MASERRSYTNSASQLDADEAFISAALAGQQSDASLRKQMFNEIRCRRIVGVAVAAIRKNLCWRTFVRRCWRCWCWCLL